MASVGFGRFANGLPARKARPYPALRVFLPDNLLAQLPQLRLQSRLGRPAPPL